MAEDRQRPCWIEGGNSVAGCCTPSDKFDVKQTQRFNAAALECPAGVRGGRQTCKCIKKDKIHSGLGRFEMSILP